MAPPSGGFEQHLGSRVIWRVEETVDESEESKGRGGMRHHESKV